MSLRKCEASASGKGWYVVKEAERIGYREMRLDTLPSMAGAIALYRKFGFEPIESYYETPVIGTIFMRRSLIERSPQFT